MLCVNNIFLLSYQQYDFTTWGGVLFCAALAIFFLSIFTPLWLALSTTVCAALIAKYFFFILEWTELFLILHFEHQVLNFGFKNFNYTINLHKFLIHLQYCLFLVLKFSLVTGWKNCHWRLVSLGICCCKLSVFFHP